jgi:hypothetical protein
MEDIHGRQRNIVWPDTLRNGRAVDMFLWRGSPDATPVQRIGAWLFGLTFLGLGVSLFILARHAGSRLICAAGLAGIFLGLRLCRNGSVKRRKEGVKGAGTDSR